MHNNETVTFSETETEKLQGLQKVSRPRYHTLVSCPAKRHKRWLILFEEEVVLERYCLHGKWKCLDI